MNYQLHYDRLIDRARGRTLLGYSERHHIKPRCIGGNNHRTNIVRLTAEEHFVAHQLLVKLHPDSYSLLWALSAMTNGTRQQQRNNKMYGWLRRELSKRTAERMRGRSHSAESRAKMSATRRGKKRGPHSPETRQKMSTASLGRPKSTEHRAALSRARQGLKRKPHTPATIEKIRIANIIAAANVDHSYTQEPAYKKSQSIRMREIWARRRNGQVPMPNHHKLTE